MFKTQQKYPKEVSPINMSLHLPYGKVKVQDLQIKAIGAVAAAKLLAVLILSLLAVFVLFLIKFGGVTVKQR